MEIGKFHMHVQGAGGRVVETLELIGRAGRPMRGDEIRAGGVLYVVERVVYEEEEQRTVRRYAMPHLYVRRVGSRKRAPAKGEGAPFRGPEGGAEVIPLHPPSGDCAILPAALVELLAAIGYREQATQFDEYRAAAAELLRGPAGWYLDRALPEKLRRASRLAKQELARACLRHSWGPAIASTTPAQIDRVAAGSTDPTSPEIFTREPRIFAIPKLALNSNDSENVRAAPSEPGIALGGAAQLSGGGGARGASDGPGPPPAGTLAAPPARPTSPDAARSPAGAPASRPRPRASAPAAGAR